jgi:transcription elongation factor Elf1
MNNWVVIDYSKSPYTLLCKRCGKRQEYPYKDMPIDTIVAVWNDFIKLHKNCKENVNLEGSKDVS